VTDNDRPRIKFPRPDRIPDERNLRHVPPIDTGGAFRPDWRMQDPAKDPKEPYGSESSGTGNDHAWSNCTMVAAALAFAFATGDKSGPYGGDMRHHQSDMSGGTDLYDADEAFNNMGQNLDVRTGNGWSDLKAKRNEGRAIVIQGEGNVPGSESFDGGHACCISPETHSDGRWLFGDPLADGWQWVSESSIKDWADNLSSGIYFAATKVGPPPTTTPPPTTGGDTMQTFFVPTSPQLATVKKDAWLYQNSALESNANNIQIDPGRDMPYVGKTGDAYIVAYVKSDGTRTDDAYWVKLADVTGTKPDPNATGDCPDCPECPECPECPDIDTEVGNAIAARDAAWTAHLTPD
jgi:hypothetical protein